MTKSTWASSWLSTDSSRRAAFARSTATGPYVAIYEIEGDNLQAVLDNMIANAGQLHMSDALQLDPPPIPRLLEAHHRAWGLTR